MKLSDETHAQLIEATATYSHGQIGLLLRKAGMGQWDPGDWAPDRAWINKTKRVTTAMDGAARADANEKIQTLAETLLNEFATGTTLPPWFGALEGALRSDSVEAVRIADAWQLEPLGSPHIPLADSTPDVYRTLEARGFDVAANHFKQALTAFSTGSLEASNSQLRSCLESVMVELGRKHGTRRISDPNAAAQVLENLEVIDKSEFAYFRGLWAISNTNGAHFGTTTPEEALFRMVVVTASVSYILGRTHATI